MSNIQPAPLLTVKDVMERLRISRQTLYNLRNAGKISAVVVSDSVRFTEQEIERFINDSSEGLKSLGKRGKQMVSKRCKIPL